ncbi:hypothetical protein VIBNIFTn2_120090 [Vibrio nigripulchritudo FTn2]|nr:hypothetical protein VIBNIFTn2_120090 [Vibrio nigripulchritudo FTn2]
MHLRSCLSSFDWQKVSITSTLLKFEASLANFFMPVVSVALEIAF